MICFICHQKPDVEHEHHLTPQAVGGKNKQTVILCSNCHNGVHKELARILALYRKGNGGANSVTWPTCRHPEEIRKAIFVILQAFNDTITYEGEKYIKTSLLLPPDIHQGLKLMQQKTGIKNMQKLIIECIRYALKLFGLI